MQTNFHKNLSILTIAVSGMLLAACGSSNSNTSSATPPKVTKPDPKPTNPKPANPKPSTPKPSTPKPAVTDLSLDPEPIIGKPYQLTLIGTHLPTDKTLSVTGCDKQNKITLTETKHIYQCTAPANANDNHQLVVLDTDGKTKLFDKTVKIAKPKITASTNLPVTGITLCGNDDKNNVECGKLEGNWRGLQQDGEVQAGQKMSYELRQHNNETCVVDKVTGLTWEQKTDSYDGLRSKYKQYTWYNSDPKTNGGNAGDAYSDNTEKYIKELNASKYCGYSDWRLPTYVELDSIVDYSGEKPKLNSIFSNNQEDFYWSSTPNVNFITYVWGVNFDGGLSYGNKFDALYVRAVRSGS
ncbi:hypothetical protein MOMA_04135 [Moraxella macacae 0408225]|uniref:Lcl C-terminal domain-containing protein n=1 Tax=Moraxella macacae 0408225 TaxID=1230338 RepID=L2FAV6_9GAMM|nr:DUF1566 domain-containing protein [Moraxella macacae]ELA09563.1 hypothetical protein MOMA_04135 [Moraxella macacae 0408225]